MKKKLALVSSLCLFSFFVLPACAPEPLCQKHEDCRSLCNTYSLNDLSVTCEAGSCRCLDRSALACEEDKDCKPLCERYRPNSEARCESKLCQCKPLPTP